MELHILLLKQILKKKKKKKKHFQTCHFDLTQNLHNWEKSEYTEKNLNLTTKIAL